MKPSKFSIVFTISLLTGCATSALKLAPKAPDRPWVPATKTSGEIIPGKKGLPTNAQNTRYVLPKNSRSFFEPQRLTLDEKKAYTLPELIDIAESNNPETTIAWNEARKAALTVGITESAYLPRLSASVLGVYRGSHGRNTSQNVDTKSSLTGVVTSLSLQWLLFDFGKRSAMLDASQQASIISNIAFNAVHQQIIHDVALAFYGFIAADDKKNIAVESQKNAQAIESAAEQRFKQGIGTIVEVSQARQRTAQAQFNVVQTEGASKNAYLGLLAAMGISPLSKIKIADLPEHELDPKLNEPIDQIIADALSQRPDVLTAYAAQKATLATVKAAKAEFLPKLFLSANGTYSSQDLNISSIPSTGQESPMLNVTGDSFGGTVFLGVTMPIYDGGVRSANVAQAEADAKNASARATKIKIDAVKQIVMAENTLKTSLEAHKASETLVDTAQTAYDAALAAYQNGVGSITDVTLAENQLLHAKNTMTDAYSASLSAAATLALATGDLSDPP